MTAYRECLFHSALRRARPTTALGCAQRGVWDALRTQGLVVTYIYSGSCNSSLCTQAYFRYPISTLRPFASFFSAAVAADAYRLDAFTAQNVLAVTRRENFV